MKKQPQHFEFSTPETEIQTSGGYERTVHLYDLIICGVAYRIPDEDIDGSVTYDFDYDIDQVFIQEKGEKAVQIPMCFINRSTDLKSDKNEAIMSHISSLKYGEEEVATPYDDYRQAAGI